MRRVIVITMLILGLALPAMADQPQAAPKIKPSPAEVVRLLTEGNKRFTGGNATHPHTGGERLAQAGRESQADHAIATVLTCSDSRVPPEYIFDVGVMDIFVVRVAGNVVNTDEAGSIEYGLAHVKTPLLVVLGHTQCGAVTAVAQEVTGHGHELERNIPPLVAPIVPAVERALEAKPKLEDKALVARAIEENVWESIESLFLMSPATRELVDSGKVKVVGAIYDVGTGAVTWLPEKKVGELLDEAEKNPERARNAMYQAEAAPAPAAGEAGNKAAADASVPVLAPMPAEHEKAEKAGKTEKTDKNETAEQAAKAESAHPVVPAARTVAPAGHEAPAPIEAAAPDTPPGSMEESFARLGKSLDTRLAGLEDSLKPLQEKLEKQLDDRSGAFEKKLMQRAQLWGAGAAVVLVLVVVLLLLRMRSLSREIEALKRGREG